MLSILANSFTETHSTLNMLLLAALISILPYLATKSYPIGKFSMNDPNVIRGGCGFSRMSAVSPPNASEEGECSSSCDDDYVDDGTVQKPAPRNPSLPIAITRRMTNRVFKFAHNRLPKRKNTLAFLETKTNSTLQYLAQKDPSSKIAKRIALTVLSKESNSAIRKIMKVISDFPQYGIIDPFSSHSIREVAGGVRALYLLQKTEREIDPEKRLHPPLPPSRDLVSNMTRYIKFANAAYGWKAELGLNRRIHFGDRRAILHKLDMISREDLVWVELKSKTGRPAFFVCLDRENRKIVVSVRGTLSMKDVLTDLCCGVKDLVPEGPLPTRSILFRTWHRVLTLLFTSSRVRSENLDSLGLVPAGLSERGSAAAAVSSSSVGVHSGFLDGAKKISRRAKKEVTDLLEQDEFRDYEIVITGHSLGAATAILLKSLWRDSFPHRNKITVFAYGVPCVGPINSFITHEKEVYSVIAEGDPFATISLGHLAELTHKVDYLCDNEEERNAIVDIVRNEKSGEVEGKGIGGIKKTISNIEKHFSKHFSKNPHMRKFYPPGKIYSLSPAGDLTLVQDRERAYREFTLRKEILDLTAHVPNVYEDWLNKSRIE